MNSSTSSIVMLVLLAAVFYFMLIRPENKRKKQAEQMRSSLKKGDRVTTIGGIIGTVVSIGDNTLVIETSEDRVRIEITKWAISNTGVQTSTDPREDKKKKEKPEEELPPESVDEIPAQESAANSSDGEPKD